MSADAEEPDPDRTLPRTRDDRAVVPSRAFEPGAVIFRQGDLPRGEAYLVHEGTVEVRRRGRDGAEQLLRTLGTGELLGEVALFGASPHSATAVARTRVVLLVLAADHLEDLVRQSPELALAIIRELARMAAGRPPAHGPGPALGRTGRGAALRRPAGRRAGGAADGP